MATLLVNTGKEIIADALALLSFFVGWGTGAGATLVTDTALFTEGPEARSLCSELNMTTTTTNDTLRLTGVIVATAPRVVTNAGIFDNISAGSLLVKSDFTPVPLVAGEAIQFAWDIVFT